MKEKENEKKSGKGKKVLLILLFLIGAGGCAFGGYYFATKKSPEPMAVNTQAMHNGALLEEMTFDLGEFTVNLSDKNEKRYIKVNINVGYEKKNKKVGKEIESKKSILRDAVNLELMSKKSTELDVNGVEKLKKDIATKVNSRLSQGQVLNIYFDNIVVQ